tara:strand:- start:40 stop:477 length:438 start_codon:yes stop_codon:yes gene_type:complete
MKPTISIFIEYQKTAMNRFSLFFSISLFLFSTIAFSQQNVMNYPSELPFQTSNDSEYYHLESSILIRTVVKDIMVILEKVKDKSQSQSFRIFFKNSKGAQLPIDYAIDSKKISSILASNYAKKAFMIETYDWINRSFRSNIPFKD